MKKFFAIILLTTVSAVSFANDGGIVGIKAAHIKMREFKWSEGKEQITKRITNPSHKIIITGGEAAKLQKILPSQFSVFTGMYPDQAKLFNESFKTLGVYSDSSSEATGKLVDISCSDAKFNSDYTKIIKTGISECTITITNHDSMEQDIGPFEPKTCQSR